MVDPIAVLSFAVDVARLGIDIVDRHRLQRQVTMVSGSYQVTTTATAPAPAPASHVLSVKARLKIGTSGDLWSHLNCTPVEICSTTNEAHMDALVANPAAAQTLKDYMEYASKAVVGMRLLRHGHISQARLEEIQCLLNEGANAARRACSRFIATRHLGFAATAASPFAPPVDTAGFKFSNPSSFSLLERLRGHP
jgi:hypothetical protein